MTPDTIEKVVYFVRHGQSEANVSPVFQAPESPLSQEGKRQATLIAERVSKLSFETLIASPYQRAQETAQAITSLTNKQPEYSDLFVERAKPASINGKSYEDEEATNLWRAWEESLYAPGIRVQDGENFDDLMNRADQALSFLQNRSEQSLVVVTHGYFLRTLIARALLGNLLSGEIFRKFQQTVEMENTGLSILRYHTGTKIGSFWQLWIYNDHAHLG